MVPSRKREEEREDKEEGYARGTEGEDPYWQRLEKLRSPRREDPVDASSMREGEKKKSAEGIKEDRKTQRTIRNEKETENRKKNPDRRRPPNLARRGQRERGWGKGGASKKNYGTLKHTPAATRKERERTQFYQEEGSYDR